MKKHYRKNSKKVCYNYLIKLKFHRHKCYLEYNRCFEFFFNLGCIKKHKKAMFIKNLSVHSEYGFFFSPMLDINNKKFFVACQFYKITLCSNGS